MLDVVCSAWRCNEFRIRWMHETWIEIMRNPALFTRIVVNDILAILSNGASSKEANMAMPCQAINRQSRRSETRPAHPADRTPLG